MIGPPVILQLVGYETTPEVDWIVDCELLKQPRGDNVTIMRSKSDIGIDKVEHILLGRRTINAIRIPTDPDPLSTIHSPTGYTFFIFHELGVRYEGKYRLRFSLMNPKEPNQNFIRTVESDVFEVFSWREAPGRTVQSALTAGLRVQGLLLPRKNGSPKDEVEDGIDLAVA